MRNIILCTVAMTGYSCSDIDFDHMLQSTTTYHLGILVLLSSTVRPHVNSYSSPLEDSSISSAALRAATRYDAICPFASALLLLLLSAPNARSAP